MNRKQSLDLYKIMFTIRSAEEKIRQCYPLDEIKTPTHLAIGEEAIAAGVIHAAGNNSNVFGTYRNHGIFIAKTNNTIGLFAELFGKKTGLSKGKAGSMHIMSPDEGFIGTSAIVASTIPVAVGHAFASKQKKQKKITLVFFGDGAIDEGVFYESVNFACLKKIPIIFVCEDNDLAIHSSSAERHGFHSITDIVKGYKMKIYESESTDVEVIHNLAAKAIRESKKTSSPAFLYLKYYRYLEHVGVGTDFHFNYRSENEYKKWLKIDPLKIQRMRLQKLGMKDGSIATVEADINKRIDREIVKVRKDPFPSITELMTDIYA